MFDKVRNLLKSCLLLFLSLILMSCTTRVNQENFEKIQPGMTMQQVVTILGEPTTSEGINIAGFSGTMATWKERDKVIAIQFLNNEMVIKTFSKQKSDNSNSPMNTINSGNNVN